MTIEPGTVTIGSLLLLLLGAYIGHLLTLSRSKQLVKHNAAIELKKAFRRCVLQIENGENPTIMVSAYYDKHHEAALEFSATLDGKSLKGFNAAVNEYSEWYKVVCNRAAIQKMYERDEPEYLKIKNKDPLKLINGILKYANT